MNKQITFSTETYYWHDGILENCKDKIVPSGCSAIVVTFKDGVPISTYLFIAE